MITVKKTYDASNKNEPLKNIPDYLLSLSLEPDFTKDKTFYVRLNEIWDDDLDIGDEYLKTSYLDYQNLENTDLRSRKNPHLTVCTLLEI